MNKKFDKEPVFSNTNKYIKTKINSFGDKVNINLPMIMLDSVIKVSKKIFSSNSLGRV